MKLLYLGGDACFKSVTEELSIERKVFEIRSSSIAQFSQEAAAFNPDLVLLDCTDSNEAQSAGISNRSVKIPLIAITTAASEEIGLEALRSGADDYILLEHLRRLPIAITKVREKFLLGEERNRLVAGAASVTSDASLIQLALRESESRYSVLFQSSPQPGWLYDLESYRFVQVNKAAIEHYGYSEQEFLSMTIWDIRPDEDFVMVEDCVRMNIRQSHSIHTKKFKHYKKSGELIDVDIYSSAIVLNDRSYRLIIAIDVTERNNYENKMTAAIIQTQEEERNEIGAELNDNVCQILASTVLKLSLLQHALPAEAAKFFQQIRSNISLATKELRSISHRLAPASFEDSTLKESLRLLLNTYNTGKQYAISLHYDPHIDEYPFRQSVKLNLYRIVQEQLSNILKHSGATGISVSLSLRKETLRLNISDNGKGCDIHDIKNGIGLTNMKRRIQLFSGTLEVRAGLGTGYEIAIEIPVQPQLLEKAELSI